jgi:hypothetical protein
MKQPSSSPRLAALIGLALCAGAAAGETGAPPGSESTLIVYGDDPCPGSDSPDEIVVCARRPEDDRFRIPTMFRARPDHPTEISWAARVEMLEDAARPTRPDSCSVVGAGGQTGCSQAMVRQWYAERRLDAALGATIP